MSNEWSEEETMSVKGVVRRGNYVSQTSGQKRKPFNSNAHSKEETVSIKGVFNTRDQYPGQARAVQGTGPLSSVLHTSPARRCGQWQRGGRGTVGKDCPGTVSAVGHLQR